MTSQRPWGVFYQVPATGRWVRLSVHRTFDLALAKGDEFMRRQQEGVEITVRIRLMKGPAGRPRGRTR